jgi:1-acyl-sn-glycerol-3-phosphate acyltransferase
VVFGIWPCLSGRALLAAQLDHTPCASRSQCRFMNPETISRTYRFVMAACGPIVRRWGRLEVIGEEHLPERGPLLVIGNHDSYWDPVAIGIAGRRRRQIRALAKSTLWKIKPLAPILNGMGQIPLERGAGDTGALDAAIAHLRAGECVGVFPEGTTTRGRTLRARSGIGRLALAVPETRLVCVATTGTVEIARFPQRPRIRVEFFPPESGQIDPGEEPAELSARCLAEIRERAPIVASGRRKKSAERTERARQAAEAEAEAG